MSDNGVAGKCSVCSGTGKAGPGDQRCICGGAGTHEAEVNNLRALAGAMRAEFAQVQVAFGLIGYTVSKPSEILGAIERLHQRALEAEEECIQLKRQRIR